MKRAFLAAAWLAGLCVFISGCDQKPGANAAATAAPAAKPAAAETPSAPSTPAAPAPAETPAAPPSDAPAQPAADAASPAPPERAPIEQPVSAAQATEPAAPAAAPAESPAAEPTPPKANGAPAAAGEGLAGAWQGALACASQQSVKAMGQTNSKSNAVKESHVFELVCDATGKPVACTVLAFGDAPTAKVTLAGPGTTDNQTQKTPHGDLELQVTVDALTYTADSVDLTLSITMALNGEKRSQNGSGTQTVKAKLADGKLQIQVQTDYTVTLSVVNAPIEIEAGEVIQGAGELIRS